GVADRLRVQGHRHQAVPASRLEVSDPCNGRSRERYLAGPVALLWVVNRGAARPFPNSALPLGLPPAQFCLAPMKSSCSSERLHQPAVYARRKGSDGG